MHPDPSEKLRELALSITRGDLRHPWVVQTSNSFRRIGTDRGSDGDVLCAYVQHSDGQPDLLAAPEVLDYIAAAHPLTILQLIQERDDARHALHFLLHKITTAVGQVREDPRFAGICGIPNPPPPENDKTPTDSKRTPGSACGIDSAQPALPPRRKWDAGRHNSGETADAESSDYVDGWNAALDAVERTRGISIPRAPEAKTEFTGSNAPHEHEAKTVPTTNAGAPGTVHDMGQSLTPAQRAIIKRCLGGAIQSRITRGDEDDHLSEMIDAFEAYFVLCRALLGHSNVPINTWETYTTIKQRLALISGRQPPREQTSP